MISADELAQVANAQPAGFLKPWKAASMVAALRSLPICESRDRLRSYVGRCLTMEGFDAAGIEAVTDAILAKAKP